MHDDICGELTEVKKDGFFEKMFPVLLTVAFLFGQL
jgi:hypothetical protein